MGKQIDRMDSGRQSRAGFYSVFLAATLYLALAIYLYKPHFNHFKMLQYVILLSSVVGALGCFVLSGRWISAAPGALFAGAVYGFSPFALGFAAYHPAATVPLAILPWLFCPCALWRRLQQKRTFAARVISAGLSLLPFVVIGLFFWFLAQPFFGPLFPLPKHAKLHLANLAGLVVPLVLKPHDFVFGFYHVPLAALLMGLFMYAAVHRIGVMIIVAAGTALAVCNSVFDVSPIVWALIPALFGSILVGLGMQGLALAGKSDTKWILACIAGPAALAVITFTLTAAGVGEGTQLKNTALRYCLAAALMAVLFFMAKASVRLHWLRWLLLCTGLGIDILLSATYIVDKIF